MAEDWLDQLRTQLTQNVKDIAQKLSEQEKWLDDHEESLEEAGHEKAVRRLEQLETVLECLDEALDALSPEEKA